ncbi:MAG: ATP-dependent Clp protease ATP-binding subunit ClpX [Planctomycetota bacterium]|nr:ATP-dependent Clp protease ATP-binding subunit ClpX [Planctomycetota bacterium]MEE3053996.1 ATP-dependent Clp protease ATP-binding subunit ClpX [Planctomycetota bacterium]
MPRSGGRSTTERCSFCDKSKLEVEKLIQGGRPGIYICNTCVEICHSIIDESKESEKAPPLYLDEIPTPRQIVSELDDFIISQDMAKKVLAVAGHNHFKRLLPLSDDADDSVKIEKSNMLLLGPTGCGKTALARAMATLLDVPFAIGDATTLTEAGYVGEDVENLILKLVQDADYNIERAQQGIIFVDEIDKVGRATANVSITRDVSGEGVQQSLLKLIEGTVANVPPQGGRKHPEQQYLQVDTTNILFICAGTFTGIEHIIAKREDMAEGTVGGFSNRDLYDAESLKSRKEIMDKLQPEDLIEFGMIPELLGRLPVVATLDPLDEGDLIRVLQEPRDALVKQYTKLFSLNETRLRFTSDALREIARLAIKRKTGARALRSILEEVMLDVLYELPDHKGELQEFVVNKAVVDHRTFSKGGKTLRKDEKKKSDNDQDHRKTA